MDWGRQNVLAVGLANQVYLWDAGMGSIVLLKKMEDDNEYICSVSWSKDGNFLSVGTSDCKVEVIDFCFLILWLNNYTIVLSLFHSKSP